MYGWVPGIEKILEQLDRDRIKDCHCLTHGIRLFRVPYSFNRAEKIEWTENFILRRAQEDNGANRARVYHLDIMYIIADLNPTVTKLIVTAGADGVFHSPDQKH